MCINMVLTPWQLRVFSRLGGVVGKHARCKIRKNTRPLIYPVGMTWVKGGGRTRMRKKSGRCKMFWGLFLDSGDFFLRCLRPGETNIKIKGRTYLGFLCLRFGKRKMRFRFYFLKGLRLQKRSFDCIFTMRYGLQLKSYILI